ncbi:MAG: ABC transporter ATP-binding protein [Candidatus Bipolaricaulota bacterium]|nr:MAG: ABC transporter ATP-binding protein [Candidatus Bipolaricaulota bacterium]
MRELVKWLWRYRGRVLAGFVSLLMVDAAGLAVPLVIRDAIDRISAGTGDLWRSGLIITGLAVVVMAFRFLWRYFFIGSSRRIEYDLRSRLYGHLLSLPASFYNDRKTGDLMAHATNDVDAVTRACGFGVLTLADPLFMIPVAVGIMLSIDPRLTLYAVLPLPVLTVFLLFFGRVIHHRFEAVQAAFSAVMEKVRENVSGIRVVKSYVQEPGTERDFAVTNQQFVDRNMALVRIWGLFHPLIELLSGASLAIVLWIGGIAVVRTRISLGEFVAFSQYLLMLTWPMISIGWGVNLLQRGTASLGRINRLLGEEAEILDPASPRPLQDAAIEIRNLTFAYPSGNGRRGEPALCDINLAVEEGTTLGVVGLTGSGKSTLAHLIPRVFDPPVGTVRLGGVDVRDVTLADLRSSIGFVPQDPFLFSATIAENIAFGRPDAAQDAIERAAKLAGIHDEIMEFPEQYETTVGERGISLSGGQKQRVAIARALLLEPRIVIFDDPLSAVDAEREEFVLGNLREFFRGRTTLIIAHRISAVQNADRIIVLDHGRIVEQGRHEKLIAADGVYQRIWRLQQAERQASQ